MAVVRAQFGAHQREFYFVCLQNFIVKAEEWPWTVLYYFVPPSVVMFFIFYFLFLQFCDFHFLNYSKARKS